MSLERINLSLIIEVAQQVKYRISYNDRIRIKFNEIKFYKEITTVAVDKQHHDFKSYY